LSERLLNLENETSVAALIGLLKAADKTPKLRAA